MYSQLVSFLVSAYNEEDTIIRGIRSILGQDYQNIQIVVINDGSTDKTAMRLATLRDSRITVVEKPNTGLADSLNVGIRVCEGHLIARQDADDTSVRSRISKQVAAFERDPSLVLCGSWASVVSPNGTMLFRPPVKDKTIKRMLQLDNQIVHSAATFKRSTVIEVGGYPTIWPCEDYELWIRLGRLGKLANIPEALVVRYMANDHLMRRPFYKGLSMKHYYRARLKCQLLALRAFGFHIRTVPYLLPTVFKCLATV
jgi:glycosyltransferase involved in cell wall biosynthesis